MMLKLGGILNFFIAFLHIFGLLWADTFFEITGIAKEMDMLSLLHFSLPYVLTLFVALIFFLFGLYGLSADLAFRKLPFLKPMIFIIASIYLIRGFGGLFFIKTNFLNEFIFSLTSLLIGLLFLIGGLVKWKNIFRKFRV